jgi:Tol biopolymer transport system component
MKAIIPIMLLLLFLSVLFQFHAKANELTPIQLTFGNVDSFTPNISGDGGKVVFMSGYNDSSEIYIINSDGTGLKQLTNNQAYDDGPTISNDGDKIAFNSYINGTFQVCIVNSDGSGLKQLTDNPGGCLSPKISGDGKKVIFCKHLGSDKNVTGDMEIFEIDSDGTGERQVTFNDQYVTMPSTNYNGDKVAFVSSGLFVVNSDGTGLKGLSSLSGIGRAQISADGDMIVFVRYTTSFPYSETHDVYVVRSDGQGLKQMTNDGKSVSPSLSSDGKRVAFHSLANGSYTSIVMGTDGLYEHKIMNAYTPSLNDDGSKIAFASDMTGHSEIYVTSLVTDESPAPTASPIPTVLLPTIEPTPTAQITQPMAQDSNQAILTAAATVIAIVAVASVLLVFFKKRKPNLIS